MTVIVLRDYGGMAPSANPARLNPNQATFVRNLDLRFGDFRPLAQPANVSTLSAGQSLYRFENTGAFITRPGVVNFVRGPIPNDIRERTYYTGDGAPKVIEDTGEVRTLGVPKPTVAPTLLAIRANNYDKTDEAMARGQKQAEYAKVILDNAKRPFVGVSDATVAAMFSTDAIDGRFSFVAPGTLVNGNFVPTNPKHRLIMDDRLKFYLGAANGQTYGIVSIAARAMTAAFDGALDTALAAIKSPANNTVALLTAEQIASTKDLLNAGLKAREPTRDAAAARIDAMMREFATIANNGSAADDASYTNPATVATQVTAAVSRAVSSIFSALYTFSGTSAGLPVSVTPNSGGRNFVS